MCTTDKTVDRVAYANGAVVEKRFNKNGDLDYAKADNQTLCSAFGAVENGYRYTDSAVSHLNTITSTENSFTYKCQTTLFKNLFSYSVTKGDDTQTVTETHFNGKSYKTVIAEDATTYTSPAGTYKVLAVGDDSSTTQHVETDSDNFLFATLSEKEDGSLFNKAYTDYDQTYRIQYDADGNVIADERNQYTYDSHGQLIRVSGADESSYTYDSRGNLLSKTKDGISVQYAYTNAQWPDQVTAVGGVALTYDQVGNLTGYGARQYNWTRGKLLESVTDEQGSYTYTYDADGYRATKVTANGKTTFDTIGGQLLAQAGPEGNLYFQYSGGTPFGFVLDDIQYYYLTNLNGDVVGITDAQGNLLAQYVYDPWGKLLQINTTEPNNAEQLAVATANPLRYRGYYYDSETGMYYLQSRYYDPDLGRFISADDFFAFADGTDQHNTLSLYVYCANSPLNHKDPSGYLAGEAAIGGGALAALVAALAEMCAYLLIGISVGVLILVIYLIVIIATAASEKSEAQVGDNVKPKKRKSTSREYQFCYMNKGGKKCTFGPKLTWAETMSALGVTNKTLDFNVTRNVNLEKLGQNAKSVKNNNENCWGVFADSQVAAKTLAVALGAEKNCVPMGIQGGYPHYHDRKHTIHIWYGHKL